ncbi:unnamed protein product [Gongylonema pulchrum]|uniref:C-type lectin domain-containing protein n=1 Tax=Gongylonema pulchrum TaxID=637853 RepID=A0A183CUU8_9BILA|nr:unnamed protein product [Gongylonema pulchrum]
MNIFTLAAYLQGVNTAKKGDDTEDSDIVCQDGGLDWQLDESLSKSRVCFGLGLAQDEFNWNDAEKYCNSKGGQLPTPSQDEYALLDNGRVPLGFVNKNGKWMKKVHGELEPLKDAPTDKTETMALIRNSGKVGAIFA